MSKLNLKDLYERNSHNDLIPVKEENSIQVVTFNIGEEEYAINIMLVVEIIRKPKITKVPKTENFVEGVVNLRGNVVPVVNLAKKFKMTFDKENVSSKQQKAERIIVVEVNKKVIGFSIEKVNEVINIKESIIEPTPPLISVIEEGYLNGVAKLGGRLIILLDIIKILTETDEESKQLEFK